MKICQVCAVDFTLKNFLLPLIDGMKNEGWRVDAVCSHGDYVQGLKEKGYEIKNISIPRNLNPIKIVKSIYLLYKLFKFEKYDVVHTHTPIASIIARLAAKLSGIKLVIYTAHGFYFHDQMPRVKFYIFLYLEKIAALFTNILFTQSLEDALLAVEYNFLPKEKVYHIGNGVDVKKFNPNNFKNSSLLRLELKIPHDAFVIGCIARLVKEKGLIEFLKSAKEISDSFENVYFVIIGERLQSDHNSNIDRYILAAKKDMGKHIKFLGLREDVPRLLSIMDLYCLPSWREGMPRSIIEAMMMGKPVLATNIRGSREQVINNKTGILVSIKSSLELKNAMIELINNKNMSIEFGIKGRKRALELYNEDKIVNLQIKIIKNNQAIGF